MQTARCVGLAPYAMCWAMSWAASLLGTGCTSTTTNPDAGQQDQGGPGGPDAAVSIPPPVTTQWQFEHPVPQGNTLHAVWSGGGDTYAVGELGAVVHLNDQGAKREAIGLTTETLRATAGTADNLWIVGDNGIVLNRQNGRWAVQRVGTTPLYAAWLQGGTLYAAGMGSTLWKNDGSGFQSAALPGQGPNATILGAAVTQSGAEIYLVGSLGRVLHFNRTWFLEADGLTNVDLDAITVAPDSTIYAVGVAGRVLRKDGAKGTWSVDHPPAQGDPLTRSELRAVWTVTDPMSKAYTVYAVADDGTVLKRPQMGAWQVDGQKVAQGRLLSGTGAASGSYAVGESGTILSRDIADNALWQNAIPGSPLTISGVTAVASIDNGVAYAVTQDSKVLRRSLNNGVGTWAVDVPLNPAPSQPLLAIWAQGTDAYMVGMAGVIMHRTDTGWVADNYTFAGRRPDLKGVWGRRNGAQLDVYAVGSTVTMAAEEVAVVLHLSGTTWAAEMINLNESLYAVSGNDTDVLAVGTRGAIAHRDAAGNTWSLEAAGMWSDIELFALAPKGGDFFAVGTKGAVLRRPAPAMGMPASWVRQAIPNTAINLTGLAIVGSDLWVAGNAGYVAVGNTDKFDMNQWNAENTLSTSSLSGLSLDGSDLLAVGSGGAVLRRPVQLTK